MPFQSEKQRRYLWANEPEIARDWTDTYGSGIAKALGGRIGFFRGAQADTASGKSMSPGTSASGGQRGGGGHHPGGDHRGPTTYTPPKQLTVTRPSQHIGAGDTFQNYNKNLRNLQRQQQYQQGAYQRAHPFLSKLGGIGGLLKGIGKAGLSFFGGIPGKALSGILTASDYAKRKGTGAWEGLQGFGEEVKEFSEHDNLMSYLNRNKVQAIKPIETLDIREKFDRTGNNNVGVGDQFIEEEQNLYPNVGLGAAEGGRIGYNRGRVVNPGGYQGDIEIPEGFLEGLPNS